MYNKRRRLTAKAWLADFVYLMEAQNCNSFCLASESNKQNPPGRSIELSFYICYEPIISLETTFVLCIKRQFAILVSGLLLWPCLL